jgi:iron complex transport system permease protein
MSVAEAALRAPRRALPRTLSRGALALAVLVLLLSAVCVIALGVGAVEIRPGQVLAILAAPLGLALPWSVEPAQAAVLMEIRAPRVVMAGLVGAALAVSGAAMQGMFRNPLADPGLIGVSAGAALAAVAVIVLGASVLSGLERVLGAAAVPVAAFLGSLAATLLVKRLATREGRTDVATLLLAGIAIQAVAMAGTGLLSYVADDEQLRTLTFWTMGSMGGATWGALVVAAPLMLLAIVAVPLYARALNALLLGEAEAGHLGFDTERVKRVLVLIVAAAVGAAVAVSGIIGFVGLVVPHLLRLSLGPDHRWLLPGSALLGAALLILADMLARSLVTPAELPIGIITALVGGPFFLWLLTRRRRVLGP